MILAPAALLFAVASAPVRVDVALDRKEAALGDRVVATYTARIPKGTRLVLDTLVSPPRPDGAPGPVLEFERPAAPRTTEEGNDTLVTQEVAFASFSAGEIAVPGPVFALVAPGGERATVSAPAASLKISSRLPQDQPKEKLAPRPERPVRIPPVSPWWWVSLGVLVAAIAAGVVLWLRRRNRGFEGAAAGTPALPPGEELIAELSRLSKESEALGDDPRGFYSALTHAVKRYLERRLALPVLEWTTFETIRHLRENGLEPPREAALPELLSAADFVKFGKGAATRDAARQHLAHARVLHDGLEAELARREAEAERAKAREAKTAKEAKA